MTKIVAIVMAYQCADVILSCLQSVDGLVDEILCFDGRWEGYTGADHSTDGTDKVIIEFAKTSKSKVSYFQLPLLHQWESRTEALKHLNNGDWAIMLDSDEHIIEWGNDIHDRLASSNAKAYRVCWTLFKTYGAMPTPRCIRKTETLHYSTDHRRVFDKDGEIDLRHMPIIHIVIEHQKGFEKKKMRKQAELYKNWLLDYEQGIT